MVSSTPRPQLTPGKDPVPILQEAWWAPGPVWTGGKSRPHRHPNPDIPARIQSLYQLSYPAHNNNEYQEYFLVVKGGRCLRLKTLPPSCAVVTKSGNRNFVEPSGPLQACNGTALSFTVRVYCEFQPAVVK